MLVDEVFAVVGELGITVALVVGASFALFRWLGKNWLESKFSASLEAFKHQKQRELESFRTELGSQLNRATRLNEREFEVLPELYRRMGDAHGEVADFTGPLQSYSDVDRMKREALDELLEEQNFKEHEKKEVLASNPKMATYQELLFWKRLNRAYEAYRNFQNYLLTYSIFFDAALQEKFERMRNLMFDALMEAKHEREFDNPRKDRWQAREALRNEGQEAVKEIRDEVRSRLGILTSTDENPR